MTARAGTRGAEQRRAQHGGDGGPGPRPRGAGDVRAENTERLHRVVRLAQRHYRDIPEGSVPRHLMVWFIFGKFLYMKEPLAQARQTLPGCPKPDLIVNM